MNAFLDQEDRFAKCRVAAVVVAAGRGERAGQAGEGPKQYRLIGGKPVIRHTLEALVAHDRVSVIVVAIHPDDDAMFTKACEGLDCDVRMVHGGASRQESTRLALVTLEGLQPEIVLIHDGVRPFIDAPLIGRVIDTAGEGTGALPAVPVSDTLKRRGDDMLVAGTVHRDGLFAAQTPQGFPFRPIFEAHQKAWRAGRSDFTDDAAIAEWAGLPVRLVEGSPDNVKMTWARDIALADQRLGGAAMAGLPDVRTGNGYDVHAFGPGDHVTLCGIDIPHERTLEGHSDADVGLHALTDALLATCGAGDIGTHFPPSDPQWKGMRSRTFVEHAANLVRERGGRIANADITVIGEAPRVGPHRAAMVAELSGMLRISPERVSVKATTNEGLGFIGRAEGIAAIATATVVFPGPLKD
ncbi:bifunctional 2-C-methyl-D-erythritol 4-phosphate cytidylyltransferase/2-C-methyl-D-erythritol 2,4-cyclodiphosphate synthase [Chelativorans sp. AA-79]|uniref:bifunctional 2-C-methyl-D-erythritol 4-phosphate cytidylyltransferase/2-C-methyl-D-erythritol 2,4-cyclodiphosphate synthase n=1 Tax=Chelativorans sp. AA-79 TaxID=3028735 RepID=UPI0023F6CAFD|nr:bifunctional 2-C-methyl-D-erythritol 4-phosphate cytidylyltransferase/2-C-methyl-D-erythritol 2,4-cyclodiphosphate synthase [Chelativorans sp. AA-79]WEX07166.1 bifunctional 2-C-methyl-D-erythritol 4-phosphate cytidylyltransferase/2-C-methyl-D-erythritol 2,4-cyclodiphosphate synthase [Chelativorans sp. AA-79]